MYCVKCRRERKEIIIKEFPNYTIVRCLECCFLYKKINNKIYTPIGFPH